MSSSVAACYVAICDSFSVYYIAFFNQMNKDISRSKNLEFAPKLINVLIVIPDRDQIRNLLSIICNILISFVFIYYNGIRTSI